MLTSGCNRRVWATNVRSAVVETSARRIWRCSVLARVARAKELGLVLDDPDQRLAMHILCHSLAALWRRQAPG